MLTLHAVSSGSVGYYSRDNYYVPDTGASSVPNSNWHGRGAQALGLAGSVEADQFAELMSGSLPTGEKLGGMVDGERIHAPGWDLTFSAPKSVSILIEVVGNQDVSQAHAEAVQKTLDYIEQEFATTRIFDTTKGKQIKTHGQSLVAALFQHDVSRASDPQTHTHAVLANIAIGQDGKTRSLVSQPLYAMQKQFGAIYRAHLASRLQALGYRIERKGRDGRFELAGMPHKLIKTFSKRTAEIDEALDGRDGTTARQRETVALATRTTKRQVTRPMLLAQWQSEAAELGIDLCALETHLLQPERPRPDPKTAREVANLAAAHLSETAATFTKDQFIQTVLEFGIGHAPAEDLITASKEAATGGLVIAGHGDRANELTTPEAIQMERDTLAAMKAGQGEVDPIKTQRTMRKALARTHLSSEQKTAVEHILGSVSYTHLTLPTIYSV